MELRNGKILGQQEEFCCYIKDSSGKPTHLYIKGSIDSCFLELM
jgi:hypothetical protein